jgi:hypothetical protein
MRFGAANAEPCRDRVKAADSDQLRAWLARILTAERIGQVLD